MMASERKSKVIVVLPAYNAATTLIKTLEDIPVECVDEILLVDDASHDNTMELAQKIEHGDVKINNHIPLKAFKHDKNRGYGGNQKTCYGLALSRGADIVVMLHPDYQYDPRLVRYFVDFIDNDYFDVMLGSRIRTRKEALAGGMPIYKYFFNRMLTLWENFVSGQNLSEWHTGMRAYRREVLESVDYNSNSNDFVFDTQMLFKIIKKGFRIGEIPVPVRYFPEASSINFKRSMEYGLRTVWESVKYLM
ncbi:MAG: glycosyltransferase family 2 protein [Candidatus Vogelbacteria bacterium]|nr:glycosyltransferase family 2 protein [Candidatus Vogelbacteria bacterium]